MPDRAPIEADVAAYLLGALEPGERARVEQELAADPAGRATVAELAGTAELLNRAAPPYEVPAGLEARTFTALERAVAEDARPAPRLSERARPRLRRFRLPALRGLAVAGAAAVLLAGGVLAGSLLGGGGDDAPGELELQASLTAPGGDDGVATADVRETGIGRVVSFDSRDLRILPKGEYYALWFVGPGDSPESPNRISAGTFHPDSEGRSQVRFAAAVDPAEYPVLAVTAERGDGDPAPTFPDLLRSEPGG